MQSASYCEKSSKMEIEKNPEKKTNASKMLCTLLFYHSNLHLKVERERGGGGNELFITLVMELMIRSEKMKKLVRRHF